MRKSECSVFMEIFHILIEIFLGFEVIVCDFDSLLFHSRRVERISWLVWSQKPMLDDLIGTRFSKSCKMKEKARSQFFIVETQLLVQSYEENVNNMDLILGKRFSKKLAFFCTVFKCRSFILSSRIYVNEIKMYVLTNSKFLVMYGNSAFHWR